MQNRRTNLLANRRNRPDRRLLFARLLFVLVACCAGGCAASGDALNRGLSHTKHKAQAVAASQPVVKSSVNSQATSESASESTSGTPNTIKTVGYGKQPVASVPLSDSGAGTLSVSTAPVAQYVVRADGSEPLAEEIPAGAAIPDHGSRRSVDHFVATALANHPKVRAARHRVVAAASVIPQARALPDPVFGNSFWPNRDQALQTAGGRVGHQFQLAQGVPWPEKLNTKAAIASREVQIARADVERIEREITESVRLAYYEVWFTTRAITIVEETRELIDDLTRVAEARYRSGGTQQDVLRAQLEADRLDDQLVSLRKNKQQAQADLATLTQQPVTLVPEAQDDIGLVDDVPKQLDELLGLAEQCSPELRALAWEIQRDREKQRLACLQKYPDFNLGLNYSIISDNRHVISSVANGHDNISFAFGVTLPIWRDKINAGIREAANRTSSTAHRLDAERDVIQGSLRRLMAQADALVEQVDIYENRIIPRTEDTLKLAIADYRGERTDFFTLIQTYRELLMFETQLARMEATLAGTVAQIERTVGCPFGG